jgi:hypothetical protein
MELILIVPWPDERVFHSKGIVDDLNLKVNCRD